MSERPYSRFTRSKTWAALYCQHINACYALVPYSATNNSIAVIRCQSPEETQALMRTLLTQAEECAAYYGRKQTPDQAPALIAKARHAVVLARSSDYYHYHLSDHTELRLVICGLHDSYLHLPVWETRSNQRYAPRMTAVSLTSPEFRRLRCTQFGHTILLCALINDDPAALTFKKTLPRSTQTRITREVQDLQEKQYRGRPLAFLTDAERREIGQKISEGLRRYHAQKRVHAV
jgi:hypothetical protein